MQKIRLAMVDDHTLFRFGITNLFREKAEEYEVIWDASGGKECLFKFEQQGVPDILLMDVNMPEMNGFQLAAEIKKNHPQLPVLVLSMVDREEVLVRMLRLGVRGYLSKDINPAELHQAVQSVIQKGYYYTDHVTGKLIHALRADDKEGGTKGEKSLSEREREFLALACSELTYKEIADKMCLSIKTVDTHRISVFEKLGVKSRTGMALYAIKFGLVEI